MSVVVVPWWWWHPRRGGGGVVVVVAVWPWWWHRRENGGGVMTPLEHVESVRLDDGIVVVLTVQQHFWSGHGPAEGQYRYTVRWYCNEYRPNMGSGVAYGRDGATARGRAIVLGSTELANVVARINGTGV